MPEYELFLKFLPRTATEEKLRSHFSECKSLQSVRVALDDAGNCKGIAWLSLGDAVEAEKTVREWNVEPFNEMSGTTFQIEFATKSEKWKPKGPRFDCKFGAKCSRPDCSFKHPDGWDPIANGSTMRPCRLGRLCTFPGCFYKHPLGRIVDEGKEVETETPPATQSLAKKRKTHEPNSAPTNALAADADDADLEIEVVKSTAKKKRRRIEPTAEQIDRDPLEEVDSTKKSKKKDRSRNEVSVASTEQAENSAGAEVTKRSRKASRKAAGKDTDKARGGRKVGKSKKRSEPQSIDIATSKVKRKKMKRAKVGENVD